MEPINLATAQFQSRDGDKAGNLEAVDRREVLGRPNEGITAPVWRVPE